MTNDNIWSEIFGFSVGDKVKVVKITDTACCTKLDKYLGRIGIIEKIKETILVDYYGKQTFFSIDASEKTGRIINTYLVLFDNGDSYWFATEDLELIEV